MVKDMPIKPDMVVFRSLPSACRIHMNVGQLLLSNLYASVGNWEGVADFRVLMDKRKNRSDIGGSWIEVNGVIHEFRASDQLHVQNLYVREKLREILKKVSMVGYKTSTTQVSFDLSDEDKEQAVAWHSEKLAIAFALMETTPGTSIRIVKNLRTCEDCQSAFKAISKVYERELIVRDRSRFHTFREGICSCKD